MKNLIDIMPGRLDWLVEAVEGFKRSNTPLVGFNIDTNEWSVPGSGDDLGIYYVIPHLVKVLDISVEGGIDLLFLTILALSMVVGIWFLYLSWKSNLVRAIGSALIVVFGILSIFAGDVYLFGTIAVIVAAPAFFLLTNHKQSIGWRHALLIFILGLFFAICNEFRSASGALGLGVMALAILLKQEINWRSRIVSCLILVSGLVLVGLAHNSIVADRDAYLAKEAVSFNRTTTDSHLFWHSVYIGFGFLNNPYGIVYSDGVATNLVKSKYPAIIGSSDIDTDYHAYEHVLKQETLQLAISHPYFVIRTLAAKFGVVMLFVAASFSVGFFYLVRARPRSVDVVFLLGIGFGFLPCLLVMPIPKYVLGGFGMAAFYGFACFAYAVDQIRQSKPINW
jgi:hypothetical protein